MIKGKESPDAENSTYTKLSVVLRRNKSVPPSSHDVIYNMQNIRGSSFILKVGSWMWSEIFLNFAEATIPHQQKADTIALMAYTASDPLV